MLLWVTGSVDLLKDNFGWQGASRSKHVFVVLTQIRDNLLRKGEGMTSHPFLL